MLRGAGHQARCMAEFTRVYIDVNTQGVGQWCQHNVLGCGRSAHRGASRGGHRARCMAEFTRVYIVVNTPVGDNGTVTECVSTGHC